MHSNLFIYYVTVPMLYSISTYAEGHYYPPENSSPLQPRSYSLTDSKFARGVTCGYDMDFPVSIQSSQAAQMHLVNFTSNQAGLWSLSDLYTAYTTGNDSSAFRLKPGVAAIGGVPFITYKNPGDCVRSCQDCISMTIDQHSTHTTCKHHAETLSDCTMEFKYGAS